MLSILIMGEFKKMTIACHEPIETVDAEVLEIVERTTSSGIPSFAPMHKKITTMFDYLHGKTYPASMPYFTEDIMRRIDDLAKKHFLPDKMYLLLGTSDMQYGKAFKEYAAEVYEVFMEMYKLLEADEFEGKEAELVKYEKFMQWIKVILSERAIEGRMPIMTAVVVEWIFEIVEMMDTVLIEVSGLAHLFYLRSRWRTGSLSTSRVSYDGNGDRQRTSSPSTSHLCW